MRKSFIAIFLMPILLVGCGSSNKPKAMQVVSTAEVTTSVAAVPTQIEVAITPEVGNSENEEKVGCGSSNKPKAMQVVSTAEVTTSVAAVPTQIEVAITPEVGNSENEEKEPVIVTEVTAKAISRTDIKLNWKSDVDNKVKNYLIMRKEVVAEDAEWIQIGTVENNSGEEILAYEDKLNSDKPIQYEYRIDVEVSDANKYEAILSEEILTENNSGEEILAYEDKLNSDKPIQYEYRIDVEVSDANKYEAILSEEILTSNIILCIDPGHFAGRNTVTADGVDYCEGDFTLEIGKELKSILEKQYGVTVRMTRDTGTITIGDYTDGDLDYHNISLRGESANGCNMFISLHTNANEENANGYGTDSQPIDINKPFVIVNAIGIQDETTMKIANMVGKNLVQASYELGIAKEDKFEQAEGELKEWNNEWNDSLEQKSSVCKRTENGEDYYGVLRGATAVDVPGMIIEHGHHTVVETRKAAQAGTLKEAWAQADAKGIVEGLGLKNKEEILVRKMLL